MADTLLQIAKNVADYVGIGRPTAVIGQNTKDTLRLETAIRRTARELVGLDWPDLLRVGSISVVASTTLYDEPSDLHHYRSDTFWTSTQRQAIGAINPTLFEALLRQGVVTVDPIHRLRQTDDSSNFRRQFEVYPTPSAAFTLYFLYQSNAWCQNAALDTRQTAWTADGDLPIIEDHILELGATYRLMASLGRDYSEEKAEYQRHRDARLGQGKLARTIYIANQGRRPPAQTPEIGFGS